jgi:hypothetical protein
MFCFVCFYFSFGQCDLILEDLYTPLGNVVRTLFYGDECEMDSGARLKKDQYYAATYPNAIQIPTYDGYSSTIKFNCHGYAWIRVELGIDRWGTSTYNPYIDDSSYIQVPQETFPAKAHLDIYSGNHSAITTEQPGWFISKWDIGPLCYHRWDDGPYPANYNYYVQNCHPVVRNMSITADRNMSSCGDITFINNTISNNAVVNIRAQDAVHLLPGFRADTGTNVKITIGSSSFVPPQNSMVFINKEPEFEEPNSQNFAQGNTDIENNSPAFNLYPNPNTGAFQLETNFPLSKIDNLIIKNLLGVTVYEAQNLTSNIIQLQNSPAGQYFVVMILKDGNVLTRKMMVQR